MPVDLGAQYRDAKAAIGVHRRRQATAEVAFAHAFGRARGDRTALAVVDAQAAVDRAVADVEWCKAVTLAAGEAYKGESHEVVLERNAAHRAKGGGPAASVLPPADEPDGEP